MIINKNAQGLSMSTIIIAGIALLVLVILATFLLRSVEEEKGNSNNVSLSVEVYDWSDNNSDNVSVLSDSYYCVEWDGWIDRHSLDYNCRILSDSENECDYSIWDDNDLSVTIYNLSANFTSRVLDVRDYNCSKSIKIDNK